MERWLGRVALVTGASAGIGKAISHKLVENGMHVVGCARNLDKLNELAQEFTSNKLPGKFTGIKCDLRKDEDISGMFAQIRSVCGRLDVCVNNAGLAFEGSLIEASTEKWREMVDVNIIALSICTREAVELMIEKNINDGQIIHISSMSGHRVIPRNDTHFYSATKYAVKALTEGLRQELREKKLGIRVCSLSPGIVETEFASRMHNNNPEASAAIYSSIECLQAEDIAQILLDVLKMPSHVEINDVWIRPTQQVS